MARRPSLAESMKAVAKDTQADTMPLAPVELDVSSVPPAQKLEGKEPPASGYRARTREGMKRLTVVVQPEEHRRIKRLAVDTDRSIEDLMREALTGLLERHKA